MEYFLDKMTAFELQLLLDEQEYSNIVSWQQARMLAFWAGNSGRMKKNTKMTDLIELPCDAKFKGSTEVDEKALRWWKSMKKKKEGD